MTCLLPRSNLGGARDWGVGGDTGEENLLDEHQESKLAELLAAQPVHLSLGDSVYLALREAIVTNILPQSVRLSGASLAHLFGVSRTPVRDALRRLESERLVKATTGSGFLVVPLTLQDIDEIYTLRAALEGCTASLAARHRTSTDLFLLEGLHRAFVDAASRRDINDLACLNARFHDTICQAAKSERLTEFVTLLQQSVRRLGPTTLAAPGRAIESVREHQQMLDAIRGGDAERAEAVAREHMERAWQHRLQQYHLAFVSGTRSTDSSFDLSQADNPDGRPV